MRKILRVVFGTSIAVVGVCIIVASGYFTLIEHATLLWLMLVPPGFIVTLGGYEIARGKKLREVFESFLSPTLWP